MPISSSHTTTTDSYVCPRRSYVSGDTITYAKQYGAGLLCPLVIRYSWSCSVCLPEPMTFFRCRTSNIPSIVNMNSSCSNMSHHHVTIAKCGTETCDVPYSSTPAYYKCSSSGNTCSTSSCSYSRSYASLLRYYHYPEGNAGECYGIGGDGGYSPGADHSSYSGSGTALFSTILEQVVQITQGFSTQIHQAHLRSHISIHILCIYYLYVPVFIHSCILGKETES